LLLRLIPGIGAIIILIFVLRDGELGSNQWGKNPYDFEEDIFDHLIDDNF